MTLIGSATQPVTVLLPHRLLGNIYVQELGRAYQAIGCESIFGPENFFESNYRPDIVHVNWPEDLYRSYGSGSAESRADRLLQRLDNYKEGGALIAWTVHNEIPHAAATGDIDSRIYQGVIDRADVIHHHCTRSLERLESRYKIPPGTRQFVAPHGHYFSYRNHVSKKDARGILSIPQSAFVYLHFGAVRGYKGIDLVLNAFRRVRRKGDLLLIAGRMEATGKLSDRLKLGLYRHFARSVRLHLQTVDSDAIQLFINAANVLVLGHKNGLNSGVAILGMSFGRPVIGPRLGCIHSVLDQGLNLTYETGSLDALVEQMRAAKRIPADQAADVNRAAAESWKWNRICEPVVDSLRPLSLARS